jgi:hypothetical protein
MVRFHYYDATFEWWWEVDDVQLGQCMFLPYTVNLPIITSTHDVQTGYPRSFVTYKLSLSNTDSISHTFALVSSHNSWPMEIISPIGSVEAHSAQPFTVTATIPAHTLAYTADFMNLSAYA